MRKQLYLDIHQRLKSIDGIKWVDWDKGQFQSMDDFENFPLPAILISIGDAQWEDRSRGTQDGNISVQVDLYLDSYGDTFSEDTKNYKLLDSLHFLDDIYTKLQYFGNKNVQSLSRTAESVLHSLPFLLAFRVTFDARVYDNQLAEMPAGTVKQPAV